MSIGTRQKRSFTYWFGYIALNATVLVTLVYLIAPLIVTIPLSFSSGLTLKFPPDSWSFVKYQEFFRSTQWLKATKNTFIAAGLAGVIAVSAAVPLAYAVNVRGMRRANIMGVLVTLPIAVPLVVVAVSAASVVGRLQLYDNIYVISMVHGALGLPLAYLVVNASFQLLPIAHVNSAMSLGAKPLTVFTKVVIPAVSPGVVTGYLFAFVFSFNEAVTPIFLAGTNAQTLPKKMWDGILVQVDPIIAVVASLMLVVTVLLMLGMGLVFFRRRGQAVNVP